MARKQEILKMSGIVNDHALIKLVESYPILYDKDQARGQRNAELKDKAWEEVSQKLHASERACITRWKSIRDRFGKEYRRVQEHREEPTYWDMFPHLLFLKDHYKHGHARNDPLIEIKYTPKERKSRKLRSCGGYASQGDDESQNEDDIDPEELLITQQLIALVKQHTVLYDRYKIRDSKNLTAKNDAWKDISESLNISEELCYKRWKKLRDRFSREYRNKKVNPEKPVMWIYFQDLMFLEKHYRKGIPLNVETLKRRSKPAVEENPWGNDYSIDSSSLREHLDDEVPEEQTEALNSLDQLLIIPERNTNQPHNCAALSEPTESVTAETESEPEEKLNNVICNIETVLRKSQDCLKSLQQQKQRHKEQLESKEWHTQPTMLQKVHLLLDGLKNGDRDKAERKILQFLCECQIKALNNEDIEDVCNVQIY